MEICFSFDTTGSMYRCIKQVKQHLQDLIQRLQKDIPGIRIAVYAHGDYYDHRNYVTKHIDFSTNAEELCNWVKNVGKTGGGDIDECYELVLQEVQKLSWTPGSQRALVMIGDSDPHGSIYRFRGVIHRISWQDEVNNLKNMVFEFNIKFSNYPVCDVDPCQLSYYSRIQRKQVGEPREAGQLNLLRQMKHHLLIFGNVRYIIYDYIQKWGVRIYGVQCGKYTSSLDFYNRISSQTGGKFLELNNFANIFDFIMAICYWEHDYILLKKYEDEVRARDAKVQKDLDLLFGTLKSEADVVDGPSVSRDLPQTDPSTPEKDPKTPQTLDPKNAKTIVKRSKKMAKEKKARSKRFPKASKEKDTAHNEKSTASSWTKWQMVMIEYVSSEQAQDQSLLWIKRGRGNVGTRRKIIFDGKYDQPSLYEFSVKNSHDGEHRVVFCKSNKGFILNKGSWETKLLTGTNIKQEINELLKTHKRIYARRRAIKDEKL